MSAVTISTVRMTFTEKKLIKIVFSFATNSNCDYDGHAKSTNDGHKLLHILNYCRNE